MAHGVCEGFKVINDKRILAIVPARRGSTRLPNKNNRKLGGLTLVERAITEGKKSLFIDTVILSTNCQTAKEAAGKIGCEVLWRPDELCQVESKSIDMAIHAIQSYPDYDYLVLLQPTSPLRIMPDIDRTIETLFKHGVKSAVSVNEIRPKSTIFIQNDKVIGSESTPTGMESENRESKLVPQTTMYYRYSQHKYEGGYYQLNGAVYVTSYSMIRSGKFTDLNTVGSEMPWERSIDINDETDFRVAEALIGWGPPSVSTDMRGSYTAEQIRAMGDGI